MTIELTDLTAAEVVQYFKEGRYLSGWKGYVEVSNKAVLKEKVKHSDGFTIAEGHDKSFEDYTKIRHHKDGTKALIKIGLNDLADYNGLSIKQAAAKELDAYIKKFGEASLKAEHEVSSADYPLEKDIPEVVQPSQVIVQSQLEQDIEEINACTTKISLQNLIVEKNWTGYVYDTKITLAKNKEALITYLQGL